LSFGLESALYPRAISFLNYGENGSLSASWNWRALEPFTSANPSTLIPRDIMVLEQTGHLTLYGLGIEDLGGGTVNRSLFSIALYPGTFGESSQILIDDDPVVTQGQLEAQFSDLLAAQGLGNVYFPKSFSTLKSSSTTATRFSFGLDLAEANGLASFGKYSTAPSNTAFVIGNGTSSSSRSNAFEVSYTGSGKLAGGLTLGGNLTIGAGFGIVAGANASSDYANSFVLGEGAWSYSPGQTILGRWNSFMGYGNTPPDKVLMIGGGTSASDRRTAMYVTAGGDLMVASRISVGPRYENTFTSTGQNSASFGNDSWAFGENSIAMGQHSFAYGVNSVSAGRNSVTGSSEDPNAGSAAIALGDYATARLYGGSALGAGIVSSGYGATAVGWFTVASGGASTAGGYGVESAAWASSSFGEGNKAQNSWSTALGLMTKTDSDTQTVVGGYNAPTVNSAFVVGIGTGDPDGSGPGVETRTNAFEVYKDGRVIINKRQGDILMGEFGN